MLAAVLPMFLTDTLDNSSSTKQFHFQTDNVATQKDDTEHTEQRNAIRRIT